MNFSSSVKLEDVSDFIAPSQACVVTLNSGKLSGDEPELQADAVMTGEVQLQPRRLPAPAGFQQTQTEPGSGAVKVTLNDCLACSGCVTSAETVLLEHQSVGELRAALADPRRSVIVSISPQSRASLARLHRLTPAACLRRLTAFLKRLGVRHVLDTSASRDLALLEAAQEFIARYRAAHPELAACARRDGEAWPRPASQQLAAGQRSAQAGGRAQAGAQPPASSEQPTWPQQSAQQPGWQPGPLPMLASACPGWVCYAEKTQAAAVLPHISHTKSPQAVMGSIVKRHLCQRLGLPPQDVYHCAIMPCYDKKLEGARDDFLLPGTSIPETDSVLTSSELQQLLEQEGVSLADLPDAQLDTLLCNADDQDRLYGWPGGSGGYMDFIFRQAAEQLFGQHLPPGPLPLRQRRNADFQEVTLEAEGRPVLRFAFAFGFKNIQTLLRKMKPLPSGAMRPADYDYVEVMACPSGCLNGGGQVKPAPGQTVKQLVDELDHLYHHEEVQHRHPASNPAVHVLYEEWVQQPMGSAAARDLLHTGYHARGKSLAVTVGDW